MTQPLHRHRYTYADYLALEESSNVKHEYLEGEIYAMAGGTPDHAALAMAVGAALIEQLRGKPCRVFSSDLRIRVLATGLAAYPDVTVVCGPLQHDTESGTTVVNPTVLVEVSSNGTEDYDRGEKLDHYRQIPSVRECLLVSHRSRSMEVWRRDPKGAWEQQEVRSGETVRLASIDCALSVDEVYRTALGVESSGG
jgi:Uma2 family endonuclease